MTRRILGLGEIAGATELNLLILERMAHEFPDGNDKVLFEGWVRNQSKLLEDIKAYLSRDFEPFVLTDSAVHEWYNGYINNRPNTLKEQLLTGEESSGIPGYGEMQTCFYLPLG